MPYPNFKNKYLEKSLFNPSDYLKENRKNYPFIPENLVILYIYSRKFLEEVISNFGIEVKKINSLYLFNKKFGIKISNIGASNVVASLENLIALGVKKIINIGIAGSLSDKLSVGDIVLCEKSIRDEGVSYHYIKPEKFAYSSFNLLLEAEKILKLNNIDFHMGTGWTIDAPYRETKKELIKYSREGILTVDMETSAIFSLARYRNIEAISIFIISDILTKKGWKQYFNSQKIGISFKKLLNAFISNYVS